MSDLKLEHCQRVSHACESAVRHASLLLDQSTRDFVSRIINLGPSQRGVCLREITKREGSTVLERRMLEALRILVDKLWQGNLWVSRSHFEEVLVRCRMSIPEKVDALNGAGFDGPAVVAETEYQRDFVLPIIEESFKTLWAEQAQERKLEKLKSN